MPWPTSVDDNTTTSSLDDETEATALKVETTTAVEEEDPINASGVNNAEKPQAQCRGTTDKGRGGGSCDCGRSRGVLLLPSPQTAKDPLANEEEEKIPKEWEEDHPITLTLASGAGVTNSGLEAEERETVTGDW